jgi:Na+/melibiose symporter-like transporter
MGKLKDSTKNELRIIRHHPVAWFKGDYVDEGVVYPWEKLGFLLNSLLSQAAGGFDGRDRLFRYTYHVDANHLTLSTTIQNIWDFANDPVIGSYMDRHPFQDQTYRRLMRTSAIVGALLRVFFLLDLGFSPGQRVVIWTLVSCMNSFLGTFAGVAGTKYFAGITPYSAERGKISVWKNVGTQMGYPLSNIPGWIFGLVKDRVATSDYSVYVYGSLIVLPLALVAAVAHTFAKNRVMFNPVSEKPNEKKEEKQKLSLKESLMVLRHNRYLLLTAIGTVLTTFTPTSDEYPIWRFIVPNLQIGKTSVRGETLSMIKAQVTGLPITFLMPFLRQINNALGGAKNTRMVHQLLLMVGGVAKCFAGLNSWTGVAIYFFFETFLQTTSPLDGYANEILNYEMLDYVEWKTGVRTEGIQTAFNGIRDKVLKNNLESATHNAFQQWSGIIKMDTDVPNPAIPPRYKKWAWPLFTLAPVLDGLIWFTCLLFFKYDPKQKDVIEADLKERHLLAEKMAGEIVEAN